MHQHENEFNFVGGEITLEVDQIVLLRFRERRETREGGGGIWTSQQGWLRLDDTDVEEGIPTG